MACYVCGNDIGPCPNCGEELCEDCFVTHVEEEELNEKG